MTTITAETLPERTAHPILNNLIYWLAAVAIFAFGVSFAMQLSDKMIGGTTTSETPSEMNN
jgi:hypothetical protein